jgi:hypothetical protein
MKKSKKIFVGAFIVFMAVVLVICWDIAQRTTFPGSKGLLKESIMPSDSVANSESDSVIQMKDSVTYE